MSLIEILLVACLALSVDPLVRTLRARDWFGLGMMALMIAVVGAGLMIALSYQPQLAPANKTERLPAPIESEIR